jgi:hypothetical protein
MDRIVFEDNEKTETSKLLRVVWSGVEFAGSINGMIDYLGQYCCSNTEIVVMVDVVPDRSKTVLDYKSVKNFCKENLKNTTIIPMLYYEYYLIRNTAKLVLCNITLLRYVFEYSPEYREISGVPAKINSFERYCKYVYKTFRHACLPSGEQRFFTGKCGCSICPDAEEMRGLTLEEKSWRIWKYVPVLPPVGSIPYITKTEPLSQIQASMEEMYNQAAEQFVRYSWCRNDLVVVI